MATIIDSFFISLGLQTDDVQRGMQQVESTMTNGFSSLAKNVIAPFAAAFSFGALFSSILSEADSVGKFARQMEMSVEDISAWGAAAKLSGGSAEGLNGSVRALNTNLAMIATTGTSRALPFLQKLGVAALDSNGKARDTFGVMADISQAIEGMSTQESAGILSKLGLDSGTINLLQSGKASVLEQIKVQKELGTYTQKDTEIVEMFNDALDNLSRSIKMSFLPVVRLAVPALQGLTDIFIKMFVAVQKHEVVIKTVVISIALALTSHLLPAIAATTAAFIKSPLAWFMALLIGLGIIIEDLFTYINGGESALQGFWEQFGTAEEVGEKVDKVLTAFTDTLIASGKFLEEYGAIIFGIVIAVGSLAAIVKTVMLAMAGWAIVAETVAAVISVLGGIALGTFGWIVAAIVGVILVLWYLYDHFDIVKNFFDTGLSAIADWFTSTADKVRNVWERLMNWFSEKFAWVTESLGKITSIASKLGNIYFNNPNSAELSLESGGGKGASNIKNDTSVSIGEVVVNTQATDAVGISNSIGGSLNDTFSQNLVMSTNGGVWQK